MALSFREIYHVREEKTMPLGLVFRSKNMELESLGRIWYGRVLKGIGKDYISARNA